MVCIVRLAHVIAKLRVIKRQFHEADEGNWSLSRDFGRNCSDESRMPGYHKQLLLSHRQHTESDIHSRGNTPPFPYEGPTESRKWRRLASGLLLSQGEGYWKLRQISLFEGEKDSCEMFRDEGRVGSRQTILLARRTRTMKRMARWLAWSLCSQSPHDKTVVARCAQWRPHQPPRLMQRKSRAKPDLDARSGRSISPHPRGNSERAWK